MFQIYLLIIQDPIKKCILSIIYVFYRLFIQKLNINKKK